ncbi:MAG: N-acetyl-gamma-glutamyl-phosphate reductase, partial [Clostridia bacterium]|nr:N-acetyl-gamma-glutamyl-phosphate reductase [Clostridia bacterium]
EVTVPIFKKDLADGCDAEDIKKIYRELYTGPLVRYADDAGEGGFASAAALSGKDTMEVFVAGCDERILLVARFDNLGKGASGAAIECMNIRLGLPDEYGLEL